MPTFDFSKKTVSRSSTGKLRGSTDNRNTYKIVKKDVLGVVGITLDSSFFVIYEDTKYPIARISYKCGKRKTVYSRFLDDNKKRIKYIRELDRRFDNIIHYLPFAPGVIVKGNLVIDNLLNKLVFRIKKVDVDWDNKEATKQLEFFRQFYNTIINNYKMRLYDV